MEPEDPDGVNVPWTAGMVNVLRSEAERFRVVSRSLEDHAVDLRQIDPRGWSGRGHDAYSARRTEVAAQFRMVAEEHARAARALDDFVAVLEQLTRHARYTADPSLLDRLVAQRAEASARAASALTAAGKELAKLRTMLGDFGEQAPQRSLPPLRSASAKPSPRTAEAPRQSNSAPAFGLANRIEGDRQMQELSDAIWRFWSSPPRRPQESVVTR
ncbi:hypothetical protein [Amycolatopsis sp. lyj-84]|uniref:hypothetical protein n=1 Tax=Amycolatopsis sp. lyj-84 TaxID=2789284 RepID=UPI00397DA507